MLRAVVLVAGWTVSGGRGTAVVGAAAPSVPDIKSRTKGKKQFQETCMQGTYEFGQGEVLACPLNLLP
jgi:hypothetical protein